MFPLPLRPKSILCLGAHADDIEIGCGGTLLQWLDDNPKMQITWVVWSAAGDRRDEAVESAESFLAAAANRQILVEDYPDAFFPARWETIKQRMGELSRHCRPDIVLTHRIEDRHQDHRVLAELTWNSFRDHLVLEYEIPKFEGDLVTPNLYVPVTKQFARRKIDLLNQFYASQAQKDWFTDDTFLALMRIRGLECRSSSGLAEGFHARKLVCA